MQKSVILPAAVTILSAAAILMAISDGYSYLDQLEELVRTWYECRCDKYEF